MKTSKLFSRPEMLVGIVILTIAFVKANISKVNSKEKIETVSPYSKRVSMCAPISRFNVDLECSLTPVAAKFETKWTNQMNITASEEAKAFFNQGLFFLYGFNHAEAERSFKEGIRLDGDCAMCYWGASLALGPNINVPMPESQIKDAYLFSQKALEKSVITSEKEQSLIKALTFRYAETPPADRSELDIAFANEMKYVSSRYREDLDIATIYAESLMDLMPWDYWEEDNSAKPQTREIQTLLDYVLEKDPDHPGANHYYIHLTEATHPELAEVNADKLTEMNYPSGHLIHMPSHIYVRVGRFNDASVVNEKAIEVDEDYIEKNKAQGVYPALYYPHNIHFLWFASNMEGRSKVAIEAAIKTDAKVPYAMVAQVPLIERFKPIPIFTLVRFGKWNEILNEPKPDNQFVYSQTMWHYSRGMAFANTGKMKKAKEELENVVEGSKKEGLIAVDNPQFPTIGISEIAINVLSAEMESKKGNTTKAVEYLEKAVAAQDALIYMEPPFFYYPVRQSLGAALLEDKRPAEAEEVYREDLRVFPENGWSLKGLHLSLKAQGKADEAAEIGEQFKEAWKNADIDLSTSVI